MRRHLVLLTVSVLLLVGLFTVYFFSHRNATDIAADDNMTNDEDYFADNITLVKYTKIGTLYYEMQGVHITHNNSNDTAFVTQPVMTLYADKNVRWHIKANDGKLYNHQQTVDLTHDVVISRFEQNKISPVLMLTTNSITLHPDNNTATTDNTVTIKTDDTHTTATGMKANLDTNYIELLNNVRSHYDGK